MRQLGAALLAVGSAVVLLRCALELNGSLDWYDRYNVILMLVAIAGLALAGVSFASPRWPLMALAPAVGLFALGESFPLDLSDYTGLDIEFWAQTAGALLMSAGGLALMSQIPTAFARGARPAAPAYGGPPAVAAPPVAAPGWVPQPAYAHAVGGHAVGFGHPPAGWYPDPGQNAHERYWSGAAWTADVR